jgi:hypothetical protein
MTFTYDLASVDENLLNISKVRLELGDTTQNAGVRPDDSNLADEEILLWLDEESNDVTRSVGRACAALSKMWTNVANITVGPRREELGKVAAEWAARAKESLPYNPADDPNYVVRIRKTDQIHDPYTVRNPDERPL